MFTRLMTPMAIAMLCLLCRLSTRIERTRLKQVLLDYVDEAVHCKGGPFVLDGVESREIEDEIRENHTSGNAYM